MSMTLIEHIEVGSGGAASIEFTSISGEFTDLFITISARSGRSATNEAIRLSFNGSTTGFSDISINGTGSSVSSATGSRYAGQAVSTTATSNTFGNVEIYIPNYAGSANKSYSVNSVAENNATYTVQTIIAGLWSNTDAISSITLTTDFANNFLEFTSATLYGITSGSDGSTTVS